MFSLPKAGLMELVLARHEGEVMFSPLFFSPIDNIVYNLLLNNAATIVFL